MTDFWDYPDMAGNDPYQAAQMELSEYAHESANGAGKSTLRNHLAEANALATLALAHEVRTANLLAVHALTHHRPEFFQLPPQVWERLGQEAP